MMYEFHYKYIKSKLNAKLLFILQFDDVYENFYGDKHLFDFSDYLGNSIFFEPVNTNVIGKMKDEFKRKIISESVGLKTKIYSLIDADSKENKK